MYELMTADDGERDLVDRRLERLQKRSDGGGLLPKEASLGSGEPWLVPTDEAAIAETPAASRPGAPKPTDCGVPSASANDRPVEAPVSERPPPAEIASDKPLNEDIPLAMETADDDDEVEYEVHMHDDMAEHPRNDKRSGDVLEPEDEAPAEEESHGYNDSTTGGTAEKRQRISAIHQLFSIMERPRVRKILEDLEKEKFPNPTNRRQRRTNGQLDIKSDLGEIYSPPRIANAARRMGLKPCWSLDLTTVDPDDGKPWDFTNPEKRQKVKELLERDKPALVVASPMCGPFSKWQSVNFAKLSD